MPHVGIDFFFVRTIIHHRLSKVCIKWVLKYDILSCITNEEVRVHHYTPKTNNVSMEWCLSCSPSSKKKKKTEFWK